MQTDKPLRWLYGEVRTPPFTAAARLQAGWLLRQLQQGENLSMPHSRPLPVIGARCHEPRIRDKDKNWRLIYRIDDDRILIMEVFNKKTQQMPLPIINLCQRRLSAYDAAIAEEEKKNERNTTNR